MKTLMIINAILIGILNIVAISNSIDITPIVSFLNSTTYIYGHDTAGSMPTWMAILATCGPVIVSVLIVVGSFVKYKIQQNKLSFVK